MHKARKMKFPTEQEDENIYSAEKEENSDFQLFLRTSTRFSDKRKGISIIWKNLSVVAELKKQSIFKKTEISHKRLIHNVTGAIFPGNLVAIMGASGSGKTTLMSVLANRNPSGLQIEGDIRINGKPTGTFLKQISGYVYQDDLFISSLTVMEHLNFAAKLRLDRNLSESDRKQLIFKVLTEVGLLQLANGLIGGSNSEKKLHLSGGERKRLSVATELLTESQLLFCDEPTTGLDSYSALKLITMMQSLVINSNRTIICSIHQPNKQIFDLFKQIVFLSDGRIVFNGSSANAIKFFESQGYPYSEEQNPAEYIVKSIADQRKNTPNDAEENSKTALHTKFWRSEYARDVRKHVDNVMKQSDPMEFISSKIQPPSWFDKLMIITHRRLLTTVRDFSPQRIRIIGRILLGILIGSCLHGTVQKTQLGLRAFQATVYIILNNNFFSPFYVAVDHMQDQMPLFYREYSNNSITPLIFYLSNIISLFPGFSIDGIIYSMIVYYLAGLRSDPFAVIMSILTTVLITHGSAAIGMICSIFFQKKTMAMSYGNPVMLCYMICCGLFIKISSIPIFLSWIHYTSLFAYACASLYIIQLKDVFNIRCDTRSSVPCFRNGLEVLKNYDYDKHSLYYNINMMLVLYFAFHIIAFLCLLYRIRKSN